MTIRIPEILAPAGSMESLKAAVAAGCDAVYIGGSKFGARAFAGNFQEEQLIEAIAYCHLRGVKVYLTINTVLKQREYEEQLYEYLQPYYTAGLDAVIVQDMGVLQFVYENFPDLDIHASTQMSLTMAEGANELKPYGVTRIVPARELSLEELVEMRKGTSLEMEVFVHGALCYSFSGQCLLSSMKGGRSGNRGRCAQPCRLPYKTKDGKKAYWLSPKDLCALDYLPDLIEAGVDSFKIEGRMKRAEYTAVVTYVYKKYRDLFLQLGRKKYEEFIENHREEYEADKQSLKEMFNRSGFTDGYLRGQKEEMLSYKRPNHNGVYVGKVQQIKGNTALVKLEMDIYHQDQIAFRDKFGNEIYDYTVGEERHKGEIVQVRFTKGLEIGVGDTLYRMRKGPLLLWAQENFLDKEKKSSIQAKCNFMQGELAKATCVFRTLEGEISCQVEGPMCEVAKNSPMTKEDIIKRMKKTGNDIFDFESLEVIVEGNIFVPNGKINAFRREMMESMESAVLEAYKRAWENQEDRLEYANPEFRVYKEEKKEIFASAKTREQLDVLCQCKNVDRIAFPYEKLTLDVVEEVRSAGKKLFASFPHIFRLQEASTFFDVVSRKKEVYNQVDALLVCSLEELAMIKKSEVLQGLPLISDSNMYVLNTGAQDMYENLGVSAVTLSKELTKAEVDEISIGKGLPLYYTIYGHLELMVSAQCVKFATGNCKKQNISMQDRNGDTYFVFSDCSRCLSTLYDGEPIELFSEWNEVSSLKVDGYRLDFTMETKEETKVVLERLQRALQGEKIQKKGNTGHFYKGIQ